MKKFLALVLSLAMILALAACGSTTATTAATTKAGTSAAGTTAAATTAAAAKKTVKVGIAAAFSGTNAVQGDMYKIGAQVALNQINKSGMLKNYNIEFVPLDDKLDPTEGVNVMNKLIYNEKVQFITGHVSSTLTLASAATIEEGKVGLLTPCWNPKITTSGFKYILRSTPSDIIAANTVMKYIVKEKSLKRVALLYINTEQGTTGLEYGRKALKEYGLDFVAAESFNTEDKDVTGQLLRIKAANPDVIVPWGGTDADANVVVSQIRQLLGKDIPIVGSTVLGQTSFFTLTGAEKAEGIVYFTAWAPDINTDQTKNFVSEFTAIYGKAPSDVAARAYDAIYMMASGLNAMGAQDPNAKDFRQNMVDAVKKVKYSGLQGEFEFDANGDGLKYCKLVQWKSGKQVTVY